MVTTAPSHTTELLEAIVMVGFGLVFTATVAVPKQVPSEAATVYMVLTLGPTTAGFITELLGVHV
jgi:hypothetical protein